MGVTITPMTKMIETQFKGSDVKTPIDTILGAELDADKDYTLTIKEKPKKRSLSANNYFWLFLDKLAVKLKIGKTELYRELIRDIGGVSDTICMQDEAVERFVKGWKAHGQGWFCELDKSKLDGCTNVTAFYGSSVYSSEQMARLIDKLIFECNLVGIDTTDLRTQTLLLGVEDG